MAEAPVVHSGENSREYVAFLLLQLINEAEDNPKRNRKQILDLYAECVMAVRSPVQRRAKVQAKAIEKAQAKLP
jgi:hypothetical protein